MMKKHYGGPVEHHHLSKATGTLANHLILNSISFPVLLPLSSYSVLVSVMFHVNYFHKNLKI